MKGAVDPCKSLSIYIVLRMQTSKLCERTPHNMFWFGITDIFKPFLFYNISSSSLHIGLA